MSKLAILPPSLRAPAGRGLSRILRAYHACQWAVKPKTGSPQVEPSALIPAAYDLGERDPGLVALALEFAAAAHADDLSELRQRFQGLMAGDSSQYPGGTAAMVERWPGEHYRLLAAVMRIVRPTLAVEIGTYTGISALAMRAGLNDSGRLVTYDIMPWSKLASTVLVESDFGPRFEQHVGNLGNPEFFEAERDILLDAEVIFCDGPKDGVFEPTFLARLARERQKPGLLIFDDIRLLNMVELWRTLDRPKLDLTSFGHWTGTGLVRIGTR